MKLFSSLGIQSHGLCLSSLLELSLNSSSYIMNSTVILQTLPLGNINLKCLRTNVATKDKMKEGTDYLTLFWVHCHEFSHIFLHENIIFLRFIFASAVNVEAIFWPFASLLHFQVQLNFGFITFLNV